jgi:hypothetical protein
MTPKEENGFKSNKLKKKNSVMKRANKQSVAKVANKTNEFLAANEPNRQNERPSRKWKQRSNVTSL